jgi:signal peptidase II
MPRGRNAWPAAAVALLLLAADQVSKAWAQGALRPGHDVTVIGGWLWFRLTSNTGATLGLLSGHNLLFVAISTLVVVAVVVIVLRGGAPGVLGAAALGAVAGGATSNLIDRLRLGSVVDFIEVHLWPTNFNLADTAIRLGVVVFILTLLLDRRWRSRAGGGRSPTG